MKYRLNNMGAGSCLCVSRLNEFREAVSWRLLIVVALTASAGLSATISDILVVTRPGFPDTVLTITDEDEASTPPGMSTTVSTGFIDVHGLYCLHVNCPSQIGFDSSNVNLREPGTTMTSDFVQARLQPSDVTGFDSITIIMGSDADTGPDTGAEFSDVTGDLFAVHPAGFKVTIASDVPEPAGVWLTGAVLFCALALPLTRKVCNTNLI